MVEEDKEFSGLLKKQNVEIPGVNKQVEFPRMIQKYLCGISMGLGFWPEIPMDVTQFCSISRGESSFCVGKG